MFGRLDSSDGYNTGFGFTRVRKVLSSISDRLLALNTIGPVKHISLLVQQGYSQISCVRKVALCANRHSSTGHGYLLINMLDASLIV